MPDVTYRRMSGRVRRATVAEAPEERTRREQYEATRARLAQKDELPADAPAWAQALWERLRAVEQLLRGV